MIYVETEKPLTLADSPCKVYYMYSNRHDSLGETYKQINTEIELEVAYKVYKKVHKMDVKKVEDICRDCDGTGLFYQIEDCTCHCQMDGTAWYKLAK